MTAWRIVPDDSGQDEVFIPMNVSTRSLAILDRTVEAYKTGEIAAIAARFLADEGSRS
jgi:hypothetical protein